MTQIYVNNAKKIVHSVHLVANVHHVFLDFFNLEILVKHVTLHVLNACQTINAPAVSLKNTFSMLMVLAQVNAYNVNLLVKLVQVKMCVKHALLVSIYQSLEFVVSALMDVLIATEQVDAYLACQTMYC